LSNSIAIVGWGCDFLEVAIANCLRKPLIRGEGRRGKAQPTGVMAIGLFVNISGSAAGTSHITILCFKHRQ
jgi:hypothetical protein